MFPGAYLSMEYLAAMATWLAVGVGVLIVCLRKRQLARNDPKRLRRTNIVLRIWLVLAVLTLPELYFALFYDQTDSFSLTKASARWSRMHVDVNRAGFRDEREFPPRVRRGQHHLCFAGDSFTFGHGVCDAADRFSDRIADALESRHPGEFVVSNIGLPGLDLYTQFELLADVFRQQSQIDTVVYTLVLNDIESFEDRAGDYYERINRRKPQFFVFRHTYFYNFLYFRVVQFTQPEIRDYYSFLKSSYEGEAWERMQGELRALSNLCRENGIELRIAVFPFLSDLGDAYPFRDAHEKIRALCEDLEIPVADLEPVFRKHSGEDLTVNAFDAHPNERAHGIAAEAMLEGLLSDLPRAQNGK